MCASRTRIRVGPCKTFEMTELQQRSTQQAIWHNNAGGFCFVTEDEQGRTLFLRQISLGKSGFTGFGSSLDQHQHQLNSHYSHATLFNHVVMPNHYNLTQASVAPSVYDGQEGIVADARLVLGGPNALCPCK